MRIASNTELMFRIIHSVNQLSICGAVTNWCEQSGLTEEEKEQEKQKESVIKGGLTCVKSQQVKLLVSPPKLVFGTSLRDNIQDFESLTETIRLSRVSELTSFRHRAQRFSWKKLQNQTWRGRRFFGQIIPLCREYTLLRVNPQSKAFATIPGGTIIRPVIEIQIVKNY